MFSGQYNLSMKKLLFYTCLLAVSITIFAFSVTGLKKEDADSGGIEFIESSWTKALEKAKKENKLIFLDAYAEWCGPCKQLKRNTFTKKKAGDFFNKHFVNVAIDMEKGEGPALFRKFPVTVYPTLIVADKNGDLVTYAQGYVNVNQLVEFGKFALKKHGE